MAISPSLLKRKVSQKRQIKEENFVSDANGVTYYVDAKGQLVTGPKVINGFQYYFNDDGTMVKGQLRKVDDKLQLLR